MADNEKDEFKEETLKIGKLFGETDEIVARLQDGLNQKLEILDKIPFLKGMEISVNPSSNSQQIAHKLGRSPRGYIVTNFITTSATFVSVSSIDKNFITFLFDDYTKVKNLKVWVY